LNLYSYCGNDPINRLDPDGLFWGKLFGWVGKVLKWVGIAAAIAVAVISLTFPGTWIANLAIWSSRHPLLSAILGINTPKFAIVNFIRVSARTGVARLGLGAFLSSSVGSVTNLLAQKAAKKASDGAQKTKQAVDKLSPQCMAAMFGKKAADALKQLEDGGKHSDLKVVDLRDKNVASNPDNAKYFKYYKDLKRDFPDIFAVTYEKEAIILGPDMKAGDQAFDDFILAHEYLHVYYGKSDMKLREFFEDKMRADIIRPLISRPSGDLLDWQKAGCPQRPK
jgi:hypothetical protein